MPKQTDNKQTEANEAEKSKSDPKSLAEDHKNIIALMDQVKETDDEASVKKLLEQLEKQWEIHREAEEKILVEQANQQTDNKELIQKYCLQHDIISLVFMVLRNNNVPAKLTIDTVEQYIRQLIADEENTESGIFAKTGGAGLDLTAMREQIAARRQQIETQNSDDIRPRLRYLSFQTGRYGQTTEEADMNTRNSMPARDDQGRFVSDDDRGRRQNRGRDRYDDDDRRYSSRGRNDDDGDRRGRGHGGWFGDSEGHSEASRRGWDDRRDDDRRYSSRRRDDDDDRRYSSRDSNDSGRGRGRDQDDDDDRRGRGHGGWFGDSEGHSEAARRGWDDRRDDDRRYSSRRRDDDDRRSSSRDDDDDDRRGRGRNHGGWFGDSEGHSEASRRGWENRRD